MPLRHATLRQFRVFESAARHLSFSRAATELHLTQPGVSMQIKELEENAGLPLFERIGRRLFLTEAGASLLVRARDALRSLADAEATLDALRGLSAGRLEIAVVSTAKYFAPHLLGRFRDLHPAIELRLSISNREQVIDALAGNTVDLAIMGQAPRTLAATAEAFAKHPLVIVAPVGHPLATRRRLPVAALADQAFIVREPGSGTRSAMEHFFAGHDFAYRVGMEMPSNETIKQAVMAGLGIAFISRHTIGLELATRRLALLDVRGLPVTRHWHVVHLAGKPLSPTAQAFKAFVLKQGRELIARQVGDAADDRAAGPEAAARRAGPAAKRPARPRDTAPAKPRRRVSRG